MRMKTFAKTVALFVVMALMMVMTISAATVADVDVFFNTDTQSVEITAKHPDGAAGAGKTINVVVTDGTTDVYWNDAVADENGKVTFTFAMDPAVDATGTYVVKMGGEDLDLNAAGDSYTFVDTTDAVTFITTVDPYDAATLQTYLETTNGGLNPDPAAVEINCAPGSDYALVANKAAIAEHLAGINFYTVIVVTPAVPETPTTPAVPAVTANVYTQEHYNDFVEEFNQTVAISLLNASSVDNPVEKYKDVFGFDTSDTSWYAKLTSAQYPAIKAALSGKGFTFGNGTAVKDAFDRAVALALYNDMNQTTKGNLVDYLKHTNGTTLDTLTGTTTTGMGYTNMSLARYNALPDTYRDMVRDAMDNGTYANFADVETAYDAALDAAELAYAEALSNANPGSPSGNPGSSVIITPIAPVEPEKDLFDDLGTVSWAKEAINALAKDGIVNGVAEGKFAPNDVLTREQFVKILVGALDTEATGNVPFTDVIASEWYANFVAIAYNSGIVNGTSETEFGIGASLTREQLCTMVYRAIKASGIELEMVNNAADFVDGAEISDWAKEAVDYLYKAGVVNGVGGNAFDPQGTTTRAMGAKVIYGVLEGGVK